MLFDFWNVLEYLLQNNRIPPIASSTPKSRHVTEHSNWLENHANSRRVFMLALV